MEKRKIYIGADSAGFPLKEELKAYLVGCGYDVTDCGTDSTASCHYPLFASAVCEKVQEAPDTTFGILICGTGIGMSMCANKYNGIRAAVCSDTYSARLTRQHNDANVLCFGERVVGSGLATELVDAFVGGEYLGNGNHVVRVAMLDELDKDR